MAKRDEERDAFEFTPGRADSAPAGPAQRYLDGVRSRLPVGPKLPDVPPDRTNLPPDLERPIKDVLREVFRETLGRASWALPGTSNQPANAKEPAAPTPLDELVNHVWDRVDALSVGTEVPAGSDGGLDPGEVEAAVKWIMHMAVSHRNRDPSNTDNIGTRALRDVVNAHNQYVRRQMTAIRTSIRSALLNGLTDIYRDTLNGAHGPDGDEQSKAIADLFASLGLLPNDPDQRKELLDQLVATPATIQALKTVQDSGTTTTGAVGTAAHTLVEVLPMVVDVKQRALMEARKASPRSTKRTLERGPFGSTCGAGEVLAYAEQMVKRGPFPIHDVTPDPRHVLQTLREQLEAELESVLSEEVPSTTSTKESSNR